MEDFCIAAFQCPSDAALAQQSLLANHCKVAMMPTPRGVTVACGLSLRFSPADAGAIIDSLSESFPQEDRCRFFRICTEDGQRVILPIRHTDVAD